MTKTMDQDAHLLNTKPSDDAGTTFSCCSDPEDDNSFASETAQMTGFTAADEVQRYLQIPDKRVDSLNTVSNDHSLKKIIK